MKFKKGFNKKGRGLFSIFCFLALMIFIPLVIANAQETSHSETSGISESSTSKSEALDNKVEKKSSVSNESAKKTAESQKSILENKVPVTQLKDTNDSKNTRVSFAGESILNYQNTVIPDDDTEIPGSFVIKFIDGKTSVEPIGEGWQSVSSTEYGFVAAECESQKGNIGILYKNVGIYEGRTINLKITINDWSQFSTENGYIKYRKNSIGTATQKFNWVDQTWQFEYSDGQTAELKHTYMTWYDIDQLQFMTFESNTVNSIAAVYVSANNWMNYSNNDSFGTTFYAPTDEKSNDDDDFAMYTTLFSNVSSIRFKWGKDYSNQNPSGTLGAGEFLGFTAKKPARTAPDAPTKTVSDKDEFNEHERNSLYNMNESFKYDIYQSVPDEYSEFYYDSFTIKDNVDEKLNVENVKIFNGNDQDVTDKFSISNIGNEYSFSANEFFLKDKNFYYTTYRIEIQVSVNKNLEQIPIEENGSTYKYDNSSTINIAIGNKNYLKESNTVSTYVERQNIPILKIWNDFDNLYGSRPDSISVNLYKNDEVISTKEITEKENWKGQFTDLDVQDDEGNYIQYRMDDKVDGYNSVFENGYLINELNNKTSISGEKTWRDNDNELGERPEAIIINLYQKEGNDELLINTVEVTEADNWQYSFNDLDKYTNNGKEYSYRVDEEEVPKYKKIIEGNNIINSYIGETRIEGEKIWQDQDNQAGKRPNKVTVNLLADGKMVKSQEVSEETEWKYSFENLPEYEDGKVIEYTVTENEVSGYTTEIKGTTLTNHYTPGQKSATVTKRWEDNNDKDGIRPDKVTVQLYANGEKKGDSIDLNTENQWTYTWQGLPEKVQGKEIAYTVKEVNKVSGYTATVNDNDLGNIIITNVHNLKTSISKTSSSKTSSSKTSSSKTSASKTSPSNASKNNGKIFPKTNEVIRWEYPMIGLLLITGILIAFYRKKSNGKEGN